MHRFRQGRYGQNITLTQHIALQQKVDYAKPLNKLYIALSKRQFHLSVQLIRLVRNKNKLNNQTIPAIKPIIFRRDALRL